MLELRIGSAHRLARTTVTTASPPHSAPAGERLTLSTIRDKTTIFVALDEPVGAYE
jgi:hypothetical protein